MEVVNEAFDPFGGLFPPQNLGNLRRYFTIIASVDLYSVEAQLEALFDLSVAAVNANFARALLHLAIYEKENVSRTAATTFKDHVLLHWVARPNNPGGVVIQDTEKVLIRDGILQALEIAKEKVVPILCSALAFIGKHDFPIKFPSLLDDFDLVSPPLLDDDCIFSLTYHRLAAVDSILKKFRLCYITDELSNHLNSVNTFATDVFHMFKRNARYMDKVNDDMALGDDLALKADMHSLLRKILKVQQICCSILYSFCYIDSQGFFEGWIDDLMIVFKKYLTMKYSALEDDVEGGLLDDGEGLDEFRSAILKLIYWCMLRGDEIIQKHLDVIVDGVIDLLVVASNSASRELLMETAITFLTEVSRTDHHSCFASDTVLQNICKNIVIPNVMLRDDDDEELSYMDYMFIRRDVGDMDLDRMRKIACELLMGISLNYKDKVVDQIASQIWSLLDSFCLDPVANWTHKECAIYLVVSLATEKAGAYAAIDVVDIERFFESAVLPELQDLDGFSMLKAASLKFLTIFCGQISIALPEVALFLVSESNVVRSYAASCVEKLLAAKGEYSADVNTFLVKNLFGALQKAESQENNHVMKCIMRVVEINDLSREVELACIDGMTYVLNEVSENPKNHRFKHHLFDSVGLLIRSACERDPIIFSALKSSTLSIMQVILSKDVTKAWRNWTNIPSLVRLFQAFLSKNTDELNQQGRLFISGVFQGLLLSENSVEQGFYVLKTVMGNLSYDVVSEYTSLIWAILFTKLQNNRTVHNNRTIEFRKSFLIFMSDFLMEYGPKNLAASMNSVQPDIFDMILDEFWIPDLKLFGFVLVKELSAVPSRILLECLMESPSESWRKMLNSIVAFVLRPENGVEEEDQGDSLPGSRLVESLAKLSDGFPGTLPEMIAKNLEPDNQTALRQLCRSKKINIV